MLQLYSLRVNEKLGNFGPDRRLQDVALDLRVAANSLATKMVTIRSASSIVEEIPHLTAST